MSKSILHKPRPEKHSRLFELIRQDTLAAQAARSRKVEPLPDTTAQALRQHAEASIAPQA